MYELILASESPRRRQLLQEAGFQFTVHPTQLSEIRDENLNVEDQILELASQKSRACLDRLVLNQNPGKTRTFVVLAADTMVVIDGEPLGKPTDEKNAFEMLRRLSGKTHFVMTAVSIRSTETDEETREIVTTEVEFRDLTDQEIWTYVATKEPLDKAGSYGIQGLGKKLVAQFRGSYSNVVGLPMEYVTPVLKSAPYYLGPLQ